MERTLDTASLAPMFGDNLDRVHECLSLALSRRPWASQQAYLGELNIFMARAMERHTIPFPVNGDEILSPSDQYEWFKVIVSLGRSCTWSTARIRQHIQALNAVLNTLEAAWLVPKHASIPWPELMLNIKQMYPYRENAKLSRAESS